MNKNIFWLLAIAFGLGLVIWSLGFGLGGCSSPTLENITSTTSGSNTTTPTIIFPSFTSEFVYLTTAAGLSTYDLNPSTGKLTLKGTINDTVEAEFGRIGFACLDPSSTFLFTGGWIFTPSSNYNSEIHAFKIDPSSGVLAAPKITAVNYLHNSIVNFAHNAAIDPLGQYVYIGGERPLISIYRLNSSTGELTFIGSKEAPSTSGGSLFTAVDPTGKFAYACGQYGSQGFQGHILGYKVNSITGELAFIEALDTSIIAGVLTDPRKILIDPRGKFIYVEEYNFTDVLVYQIDQTTGKLSLVQTEGIGAGIGDIAIDPLGRFLYVATGDKATLSRSIKVYSIDSITGKLSLSATKDVPAGSQYIAADPSGKFICLAPDNFVAVYGVHPSTGELTLVDSLETGTINYRPEIVGIK